VRQGSGNGRAGAYRENV